MSATQQRSLLLIRHAAPTVVPGVPAREWRLSADGRRRCEDLAQRVKRYNPRVVVTSVEPKARETAELVAARLGLMLVTVAGLHEHERDNVGYLERAEFEAAMARFFARPDEPILGRETAAQTLDRFSRAVDGALAMHATGDIAMVTHGTVLALFVAARAGLEPGTLWRGLALPDLVVLALPGFRLLGGDAGSAPTRERS